MEQLRPYGLSEEVVVSGDPAEGRFRISNIRGDDSKDATLVASIHPGGLTIALEKLEEGKKLEVEFAGAGGGSRNRGALRVMQEAFTDVANLKLRGETMDHSRISPVETSDFDREVVVEDRKFGTMIKGLKSDYNPSVSLEVYRQLDGALELSLADSEKATSLSINFKYDGENDQLKTTLTRAADEIVGIIKERT